MCRSVMICAGVTQLLEQLQLGHGQSILGAEQRGTARSREMETKPHWTSWIQPPVHHHTGDRKALPALWDNRARASRVMGGLG